MNIRPLFKRLFTRHTSSLRFSDVSDGIPAVACVDLGAFTREVPDLSRLDAVVIMEDRLPNFFMEHERFDAKAETGLNRHGPHRQLQTQADLKRLVVQLQEKGLAVYIGFWGQYKGSLGEIGYFSKRHPELRPLDSRSSDMNPLAHLQTEGMAFAEYVVFQYQRLARDFGFNGLFLGDGLNGYRIFQEPEAFRDKRGTIPKWNHFYRTIALGVHNVGGKVFAYDCMGFSPFEAILHGADYRSQALAGLDYLVVQTYPYAWGEFWLQGKHGFDFASARDHLRRIKQVLNGTHTKVLYTLEIGDRVEGWAAPREHTLHQQEEFDKVADGKLLVWGNEMIARL